MKNEMEEPDFIGGQGSLTEKEEQAIGEYFTKKKKEKANVDLKKSNSGENSLAT
ncbi:MAG: hypothetical protein WBG71_08450 [Leeuwenhoekiella sp.]